MPIEKSQLKQQPVIIVKDDRGQILRKVSVKEWMENHPFDNTKEDFELKLYREALNYFYLKNYDQAEDLLIYLCEGTAYQRYEYTERLATLYHTQNRLDKERCILLLAKRAQEKNNAPKELLHRITRRLSKVDELLNHYQKTNNLLVLN
ncbi:hypothetical protein EsVE80_13970 [Enterococcus saigonensis]|uniref:Bacterial transcriptional activator domain-containing protein n=1 Tax=Enterococcus saigonensis TaxID=1805431 RepID=A0A679IPS6_9ENTE|nr:hypothetical protein [Enterococcus saigonensis]BCA85874.1 hypothetical protein EsVE80_13970 [Enterococcus saigonensis]